MGTVTNLEGNYTLQVPQDARSLMYSFVGYRTQEVAIEGRSNIDVVLPVDVFAVDEVVVVGYGIQRKREVTGSISQVKGDEIATLATPSFEAQLAGRAPGVQGGDRRTRPRRPAAAADRLLRDAYRQPAAGSLLRAG